jgi:nicotinate-nucleotide--dimethylbenzimidazole phosphoribosyltransferase
MMILPNIPPYDHAAAEQARMRQDQLTKPQGALGLLEELSIRLAGMTGKVRPCFLRKGVIIMAGDHGVAMEGVSAYPPEVTPQMVLNFLHGGAAINVLARQANAKVMVVDIGVNYEFEAVPGLLQRKIAHGTRNMISGPAMTAAEVEQAVQVGLDVVAWEIGSGLDLVATGEMGIGNTTPSAAITAVLTGLAVEQVTGRGTGVDEEGWRRKVQVIKQAIAINQVDANDPMTVLAKLGGFEIAGLVGVVLGAAARRVPVVVDGFISATAALIAARLVPEVRHYLIASHRSVEIGHQAIWDELGLQPLLNLGMRLGEGSGAVLAFNLIEAATRILDEMATFGEAGVSEKE